MDINYIETIYSNIDKFFEEKKYNEAMEYLNNEIAKNDDNPILYSELGRTYMALEDYDKAHESFDKSLSINPNNSEIYYYKAIMSSISKNHDGTLEYVQKIIDLDGESDDILNLKGLALFSKERYADSVKAFKKATSLNPKAAIFEYNLGKAYARMTEFKNAINAFDRAISIDDSYGDFYFEKSKCFAALGEYSEASDLAYKALEIDKEHPFYQLSYLKFTGMDYLNQNKPIDAIPFLEKLLEKDTSIDNSILLARAYVSGREEEAALAMYDIILNNDTENAEIALEKADYLSENDRFDEALKAYAKFVDIVERNNIKEYREMAENINKNLSLVENREELSD